MKPQVPDTNPQSKSNSINPIQTHFTSFHVTQQAKETRNEAKLKMEEQKKKPQVEKKR